MKYSNDIINIDPALEAERIIKKLKEEVTAKFRRKGAVIGVSGGIDSSVVLALCVKAFGPDKVFILMLPEKDSSPDSLRLASSYAEKLGVSYAVEQISDALDGFGCYRRRDEAVQKVFPEYNSSYKMKIGIPQKEGMLNVFYLTVISPDGVQETKRLPIDEYLQIVAASNFKQRSRMCMLYYYAELKNYCVIGTSNKNEYELGFFVKHGDNAADLKPITHLFKTQVYQLAEYLNVPDEIRKRKPTSDTYSAEQTQEEFFFRTPFDILDKVWIGWEKGFSVPEIASVLNVPEDKVDYIISDIKRKIQTTEYLRSEAVRFNV